MHTGWLETHLPPSRARHTLSPACRHHSRGVWDCQQLEQSGIGPRWWVSLGPGWSGDPVGQLSAWVGVARKQVGRARLGVPPEGVMGDLQQMPFGEASFPGTLSCLSWTREERLAEGGGAQRLLEGSGGLERSKGCGSQTGGPCSPLWPGRAAQDLQLSQRPHLAAPETLPPTPQPLRHGPVGSQYLPFSSELSTCLQFRSAGRAVQGKPLLPTPHHAAGGRPSSPRCRSPGPQGLLLVSGWMVLLSL